MLRLLLALHGTGPRTWTAAVQCADGRVHLAQLQPIYMSAGSPPDLGPVLSLLMGGSGPVEVLLVLEAPDTAEVEDFAVFLQHAHLDSIRIIGVTTVARGAVLAHLGLPADTDVTAASGCEKVIAAVNATFESAFNDRQFDQAWAVALAVAGASGPWSVPQIFEMLPSSRGTHPGTHQSEHAEEVESARDRRSRKRPAGPAPAPDLLTVDEVCERLGLSERKLRQLVADRRIAVIRIGRSLRFDKRAAEEFVQATRVPALRAVEPVPVAPLDSDHLDELVRKHGLD